MNINAMLSALRVERQRLDQAIAALEALDDTATRTSVRKRNPAGASQSTGLKSRRRRRMSAAGRKRISKMMKARWAARRKATKKA